MRLPRASAIPGPCGLLLTTALIAILPGCGTIANLFKSEEAAPPDLSQTLLLTLTADKSVYRPGEAVRIELALLNTAQEEMQVRKPTTTTPAPEFMRGSISVYFGRVGERRRLERFPVVTTLELAERRRFDEATVALAAGESIDRPFLLTQLTENPGRYVIQLHMEPLPATSEHRSAKIYSNELEFEVYGDRLFERDSKGMIVLADAARLAMHHADGPVAGADAILIEDVDGVYKWWINVDRAGPEGAIERLGFRVDVHRGQVWSSDPFPDSMRQGANRSAADPARIPPFD